MPRYVRDPVCGVLLDPERARYRLAYEGRVYYFCSRVCYNAFRRNPERFTRPPVDDDYEDLIHGLYCEC